MKRSSIWAGLKASNSFRSFYVNQPKHEKAPRTPMSYSLWQLFSLAFRWPKGHEKCVCWEGERRLKGFHLMAYPMARTRGISCKQEEGVASLVCSVGDSGPSIDWRQGAVAELRSVRRSSCGLDLVQFVGDMAHWLVRAERKCLVLVARWDDDKGRWRRRGSA